MPSIESELEDVAKLRHMANEFAEGFNTGDVERIMRFYGDSYVDINLRNPVQSRQERREYYVQVIRKGGFKAQVQPEEILIRGEYAFYPRNNRTHTWVGARRLHTQRASVPRNRPTATGWFLAGHVGHGRTCPRIHTVS